MSYINPYIDSTSRYRLLDTLDFVPGSASAGQAGSSLLSIGSLNPENAALLDDLVFGYDEHTFNHVKYSIVNLDDSFASTPSYDSGMLTGFSLFALPLTVGSNPKDAKFNASLGADYNYFSGAQDELSAEQYHISGGIFSVYLSSLLRSPKCYLGSGQDKDKTEIYATLGLGVNYNYTHGTEMLDGMNALRWDMNTLTFNFDKVPFVFGSKVNFSYQLYMSGTLSQNEKTVGTTQTTGTDAYKTLMGAGSLNSASGSDTFTGSTNWWQRYNMSFDFADTGNYMPSLVTFYLKSNTQGNRNDYAVGAELFNKEGMYGGLEGVSEGGITKWTGNLNMQFMIKDLITWKDDKGKKQSVNMSIGPNLSLPYFNNPNGLSVAGGVALNLYGVPGFRDISAKVWGKYTAPDPKDEETNPAHVSVPSTITSWNVDPSLGPGQLSQVVSVDAPASAIVPGQNITIDIYMDNAGDMDGVTGWYPVGDGGEQITDDYVPVFLENVRVVDYGDQSNPVLVPVTFVKEEILDGGKKKITVSVDTSSLKAYQAMKVEVKAKINAAKYATFKASAGSEQCNLVVEWNL